MKEPFEFLTEIFPFEKMTSGRFLKYAIILLALIFSIITLVDLLSSKDLNSSTSILSDETLQFELRKSESQFREKLVSERNVFVDSLNLNFIDSITSNAEDKLLISRFLLVNKIKNRNQNKEVVIPIDKPTNLSPFVNVSEVKVNYEIDFERLEKIIESSENKILTNEILRFGNFLNTSYDFHKKIKYGFLTIVMLSLLTMLTLAIFIERIGIKSRTGKIEETANNLSKDKRRIKYAKDILEDEKVSESEIKLLKKIISQIEKDLDSYKINNILDSVLFEEVNKAERKSHELYNRSTFMLILGLLVAIAGVIVFYLTLPEFDKSIEAKNYLALTIRPALILIFIQTISFYLLKQYRSLINDFKYFHSDYSRKSRIFSTFQLIQNGEINDHEAKFIEMLMSEKEITMDKMDKDNEVDTNSSLLDLIKALLDKVK